MRKAAEEAGITILPEFGMDPGIDLVLLKQATVGFNKIERLINYGAGFPEPSACDNPLNYKVTWTFEGVLNSYKRAGKVVHNGQVVEVADTEMFSLDKIHTLSMPELGELEAFPNGNVMKYVELLNLNPAELKHMGRYVLRWSGHCAFWRTVSQLHLLDDEPVNVNGIDVQPKKFLNAAIGHQLQYAVNERDIVVVQVETKGFDASGKPRTAVVSLTDYRDLTTGLTAMSRTVGFTASIGAQMLAAGKISKKGIISPLNDVPFKLFKNEMAKRNLHIEYEYK
ncbi:MAG: saccharopine dehydrogenase [Lentisphaerae bacterium]|nr:saccharopine dehydrogenase [Lentisphaerota bacterium]MCP4102545.1 saccharopine dehydrogenase [Lentisphaerota bacterium]